MVPFSEANSRSYIQEIPRLLLKQKVQYNSSQPNPILNQTNPINNFATYFFKSDYHNYPHV
jgi:hypothetical protein